LANIKDVCYVSAFCLSLIVSLGSPGAPAVDRNKQSSNRPRSSPWLYRKSSSPRLRYVSSACSPSGKATAAADAFILAYRIRQPLSPPLGCRRSFHYGFVYPRRSNTSGKNQGKVWEVRTGLCWTLALVVGSSTVLGMVFFAFGVTSSLEKTLPKTSHTANRIVFPISFHRARCAGDGIMKLLPCFVLPASTPFFS